MILDEIAAYAIQRVATAKELFPLEKLRDAALQLPKKQRFKQALQTKEMSFICEVKKASPSKGVLSEDFPYLSIAKEYQSAGADCISCLTEPKWFMGSDEIFRTIREVVSTPMLRKDFTVDEYQLYESKMLGADAVLLICALLDTRTIAHYLEICDALGLSALVEAHDEAEIESAVQAGAQMIGVNNRNLKDFTVNFENAARLREKIPANVLFVAESGVSGTKDIACLKAAGADAVLVGEALMKAANRSALLEEFRRAAL
ncbi:indole-3-glycerol phosphate synthase TrpC [Clostridium merdae]|uniref:indole-3-glycerol phosphate synthase TrpC n=1 Tax=Clostridium merdae TaxID=1958780 RepID=UPI000A26F6E6|nr:indole-3-glycerol phosphate synthase TrpC [Clostridium merdae]